jgi:hypothetical protein
MNRCMNILFTHRLSYKLSSAKEYTHIERDMAYFKCPRGIGVAGDYCYDLSDFDRGVQYTSEVSARVWHAHPHLTGGLPKSRRHMVGGGQPTVLYFG